MAEEATQPDAETSEGSAPEAESQGSASAAADTSRLARWRRVWQAPGVALAIGALVFGLVYAARTAPSPEFDRLLAAAEKQIEGQDFDAALSTLNDQIAAWTDHPTFTRPRQQQFHTLRA